MHARELWLVAISFLIVIVAVGAFYVLPKGRIRATFLFISGAGVIASLRVAKIPPGWFDGSGEGFWLGVSFALWAFVSDRGEERSFGRPLLLGVATALFIVNVAAHF